MGSSSNPLVSAVDPLGTSTSRRPPQAESRSCPRGSGRRGHGEDTRRHQGGSRRDGDGSRSPSPAGGRPRAGWWRAATILNDDAAVPLPELSIVPADVSHRQGRRHDADACRQRFRKQSAARARERAGSLLRRPDRQSSERYPRSSARSCCEPRARGRRRLPASSWQPPCGHERVYLLCRPGGRHLRVRRVNETTQSTMRSAPRVTARSSRASA